MLGEDAIEELQVKDELDGENILMHCTFHNDCVRLNKAFTDPEDTHHASTQELLNSRIKNGKTPLEMAAMMGRADILKDLIKLGCDVDQQSNSGYTALHFASCWGHLSCLEQLFEAGAKLDHTTDKNETPKQIALRYGNKKCVEYLDWAAAKVDLTSFISFVREMIVDPEKMQGIKPTKEEKSVVLNSCNEKQEWLDEVNEPLVDDFIDKRKELEKQIEFLTLKINSPAPTTGDSGKSSK